MRVVFHLLLLASSAVVVVTAFAFAWAHCEPPMIAILAACGFLGVYAAGATPPVPPKA